jgi:hypothetical protein
MAPNGERVLLSDRGICDLCEQAPCLADDLFCAECRAHLDASADEVVDPVEKVLAAHRRLDIISDLDKQECGCGWKVDSGPALHRRHVAAHVYAALGLDGPEPWIIGPESTMGPLMEAAAVVDLSGGSDAS